MNRYNLALLLLTLAVVPLFYISSWLGAVAVIAIYCLFARLANNDLDRQARRNRTSHIIVLKSSDDTASHDMRLTWKQIRR